MGAVLTAARLGIFGQVAAHRLRCPSDADPGANDYSDEQAEYLATIEEAETQLSMARELVEAGHFQQARDRMNAAIGWLTEEQT